MAPRDTQTGAVLEAMILPALKKGHYTWNQQVHVGARPGGRKHKIDLVVHDKEKDILVSLKWQQSSGTAEQKIPFEVICLGTAIKLSNGHYDLAYLVLGGTGWTLRDYYVGGGLLEHLTNAASTKIVTLEQFVALANKGKL